MSGSFDRVVLTAPAKLTLSLRITGTRDDGYHLINAEMVTLDVYDTLVVGPAETGLIVEGGGDDIPTGPANLVTAALELAGRRAGVRLIKRIPSQAGLGGGSADAGAILRWAEFDTTSSRAMEAASRLGADVPFCIRGGRARVTGIGERLEPLPFQPRDLTLITPPIPCPTPAVFRAWDALDGPTNSESPNDLEPAALVVAPELARWRDEFAAATGQRPTLAGSGSTWFVEGHHPGPGRTMTTTTPEGWSPGTGH